MAELLRVNDLQVQLSTPAGTVQAVRGVSFALQPGETLAVVGESGCGKSILCKAIAGLLPKEGKVSGGSILFDGTELAKMPEKQRQKLRGSGIAMLFQDTGAALDPTLRVGKQLERVLRLHDKTADRKALRKRALALLSLVGIEDGDTRFDGYPFCFSGGEQQRIALACALAGNPRLLLADEPTSALDVLARERLLQVLHQVQKQNNMAMVLVTHDWDVARRMGDRLAVFYAGRIVELGTTREVCQDPRHPYTWALLRSRPGRAKRGEKLYTLPGMPPTLLNPPKGDAFAARNEYALWMDYEQQPPLFAVSDTHFAATWLLDARAPRVTPPVGEGADAAVSQLPPVMAQKAGASEAPPGGADGAAASSTVPQGENAAVLRVQGLCKTFPGSGIQAADAVSFTLHRGEIFALVGESGSGKSTIARCILGLERPDGGQILYGETPVGFSRQERLCARQQLIFQDSVSSLDPRMTVAQILEEPFRIRRMTPKRGSLRAEAAYQLRSVGMDASYLDRRPGELSGGQRQRVGIARALCLEPELLVADEPVAALDTAMQAQIINLFEQLRQERGFSMLFIAHDLAVVRHISHRVGVLYRGRLVELAPTETLFARPLHPYTRALLAADCRDGAVDRFPENGDWVEAEPGHFVRREVQSGCIM